MAEPDVGGSAASAHRWGVAVLVTLGAVGVFALSYFLQNDPWLSSALSNIAGALLLLIPADMAVQHFRSQLTATRRVAAAAQTQAEAALETAERVALSLADVEGRLIEGQAKELDDEIAIYQRVLADASRGALLNALRHATQVGLITEAGVRVPVWWTDLHYRFVVNDPTALVVRLESDDQRVMAECSWDAEVSAESFYALLVASVREAGRDLGTGLNVPTESVAQLVDMLIEVTRLRSQEPLGHRSTLRKIIERRDGWYFTEKLMVPVEHLEYLITSDRLNEMDWEEHLERKRWDNDAAGAIRFARRLYGTLPRVRPSASPADSGLEPDEAALLDHN